jgi:hypothetical protein
MKSQMCAQLKASTSRGFIPRLDRRETILVVTLLLAAITVWSQQPAANPDAVAAPPPPNDPITREQLAAYLKASGVIDGDKLFVHAQLETKRKTLPAWFPQAVWDDVERQEEAIDVVELYMPIYRKYMSHDTAEGLLLVYAGPTGEEYARVSMRRQQAVMLKGLNGYNADIKTADEMDASGESQLLNKRIAEMTPAEKLSYVHAAHALNAVLKPLDDEQSSSFSNKTNEVGKATLTRHGADLNAAQRKAQQATAPH